MNNLIKVLIATALMLFVGLLSFAKAAVTIVSIDNINLTEFNNLNSTYPQAWKSVKFQAGGVSGQLSYEMLLSVPNELDVYGEHTWIYPDSITVSRDLNGTMYMTAGNDTISQTVSLPFNTILVRVVDKNTIFGDVTFNNGLFSTNSYGVVSIPNVTVNESSRYFRINLGETNPVFQLTGELDLEMTGSNNGYIEVIGLQIPEPSSFLMSILLIPTLCFFHRR